MKREKSSESVCIGHPDKLCDLIADKILDAAFRKDKASRVACEVMATKGKIIVAGEITCSEKLDIRNIVRQTLKEVGYNPLKFLIYVFVQKQSADIKEGVDNALEFREGIKDPYSLIGAGDQGTMYGYATKETKEMLPLPIVLSNKITKRLDKARKDKLIKGIFPDGKAQVTIEYEDNKPLRVKTIVVSIHHHKDKDYEELEREIIHTVLYPAFEDFPFDEKTEILINPSGRFVIGGPTTDTGLTGRKLMVDTYGGLASHGGGALCGKDPTKVDRSGAYMARFIAKHIIWGDFADECEIALSYAIGKANPVSFSINTFGSGTVSDEILTKACKDVFNLKPAAIIEHLRLRDISYSETATYGHFSSVLFPWESLDKYEELKKMVEKHENKSRAEEK
ncbi:methionine adenosyltransferase [Vagococcus lutrae]|uniref:methionine adenosyltransferase n=1 Tax=Vagococcus lutrae TaxID=81947 RepID=UPI002891E3D3|nr:methionine adenosyltransferase [Vagococcus lutrae]MDT2812655.1 methionine adenosyltransferase [Vagococcus lutrae]